MCLLGELAVKCELVVTYEAVVMAEWVVTYEAVVMAEWVVEVGKGAA